MEKKLVGTSEKLKILILSAPVGSGHKMAAQALREALRSFPQAEVTEGDVFSFFPALLGKAVLALYKGVLKICPEIYALSYRWGNQSSGSTMIRNGINRILLYLGSSFLQSVRPDIVISTHATPTGILSLYKKDCAPSLWLGVVVTDFTVHRWLVCEGVDAYFLAAEPVQKVLERLLPQSETPAVRAFGIPLREAFRHLPDIQRARRELRDRYGWPGDAFVCLATGGGEGLLPMEEIAAVLRQEPFRNLHMVLVTGRDQTLLRRLRTAPAASFAGDRMKMLGFTEDMPLLMLGADVVVGKAGGVSAAEALAAGSSLTVYRPLPGQEQANAAFLQKYCKVKAAADIKELTGILLEEMAFTADERIRRQKNRQLAFGHPDGAEKIADFIMGFTDFFHI